MRSYSQPEFSRAKRTTSSSTSAEIRGRPGYLRDCEPSNLRAISRRYQARMVSGLAAQATFSRVLRPSRLPISASVRRSGSDRRSLAGRWARRTRFSAARYSFWRSNSWFTSPVTYASRRAHGLPFMRTVHHRRFLILGLFEYFDHSATSEGWHVQWGDSPTGARVGTP